MKFNGKVDIFTRSLTELTPKIVFALFIVFSVILSASIWLRTIITVTQLTDS
jgi:hypothetical protein